MILRKILYLMLIATIFITIIAAIILVFIYTSFSDKDFCLDSNICKEGLTINTEHGKILINKSSCENYNWKWLEDTNSCFIK